MKLTLEYPVICRICYAEKKVKELPDKFHLGICHNHLFISKGYKQPPQAAEKGQ